MNTPKVLLIGLAVLILWALLSVATYHGWIHGTDHRDFYPRWAGARLALFEDRDLYSVETTRQMQLTLYGREIPPDRDQQGFAYPALLVPLLLPFWFIPNVEIATAVWEGLSVLLMLGVLMLLRRQNGIPLWGVVLLMLWYYPILMIFQAQITALPLVAIGVGCWAYSVRRDTLAGVMLVVGLVKVEQVFLPIAVLLVLALLERRWRLIAAFGGAGAALFTASVAIAGWWIPDWLEAVGRYAGYAQTASAFSTAWQISPLLSVALAVYVTVLLARLYRTPDALVAAAVPLGMLLIPQTLIWGLTMLLLPLALAWRGGRWLVIGVWLIGWLMLLGIGVPDWWRVQSLVLCALTLGVVVVATRKAVSEQSSAISGHSAAFRLPSSETTSL